MAKKLAVFVLLFYVFYYLLSIILVASFHSPWTDLHLGLASYPFQHAKLLFNPAHATESLGRWLAMVLNYLLAFGTNYFIVKSTRLTWDYVVTTSIIHFILTCLVTLSFPVNWIWWVTIIVCTAMLCTLGELSIYFFRDLKDIDVDHA